MRGIAIREGLVSEWGKRGVVTQDECALLTADISKATFGLNPTRYKKLKGLKRESLRDHMTDLELIFTMLGEASTTEITRAHDAHGFPANRQVAQAGGKIAGDARNKLEQQSGRRVVSPENRLPPPASTKARRLRAKA
jgi:hypothetical protein